MATRSRIGYWDNGKIKSIYCHWDGYVTHNGRILCEKYSTNKQVEQLIKLGGISSLKDNIKQTKKESYKVKNGEDIDIDIASSLKEYSNVFEEFNYLFKDNNWFVVTDDLKLVNISAIHTKMIIIADLKQNILDVQHRVEQYRIE